MNTEEKNKAYSRWFTDEELHTLRSSATLGGANDDDCEKLIEWAVGVRSTKILLQEVLTSRYIITVSENGVPRFAGKRT